MRFFLPLHFNISSNFGNFRCITRALFPLKFTYSLRFNSIMRAQMSWVLPLYVCTCSLLISSCFCSTKIQPIVMKYPETKFISFVFYNSVSINIATFGFRRKYFAHTVLLLSTVVYHRTVVCHRACIPPVGHKNETFQMVTTPLLKIFRTFLLKPQSVFVSITVCTKCTLPEMVLHFWFIDARISNLCNEFE